MKKKILNLILIQLIYYHYLKKQIWRIGRFILRNFKSIIITFFFRIIISNNSPPSSYSETSSFSSTFYKASGLFSNCFLS